MTNNQISLSPTQIDYMKHTIGYNKRHVKRGKYEAYRNHFDNGEERDADWDNLVEQGLAKQYTRFGNIVYCVSDEGKRLLESILDVKITESR